jgi:hemolysin activation/secretion protein
MIPIRFQQGIATMKFSTLFTSSAAAGALLVTALPVLAQTPPVVPRFNIGDAVRQADEARQSAPQPSEAAVPVLPRLVEPPFTMKDKSTLLVRHFKVEGAEVVSEAEIREILTPYENRKLTLAQIYEAADKITTLYRDRGYLLAKAYVPAQNATGGTLRVKVVPGRYGSIARLFPRATRYSLFPHDIPVACEGASGDVPYGARRQHGAVSSS